MPNLRKIAASIGVIFVASSSLLFTTSASADSVSGLNLTVYTYDPSIRPDRVPYTLCDGAWTHVDNIDQMYDDNNGGIVAGCQDNFVLVHYTGFVTFPDSGTYTFEALADDGFYLSLDETPIITNDWYDKGRWGGIYPDIQIVGGHTYALDAWYYEYGGGANATLTYSTDNGNTWSTVPPEFFTTDGFAPVIVPPVVEPPVVVPPVIDPPIVEPPVVDPPVIEPPVVDPPVVVPPVVDPPVVTPPVVTPPVKEPVVDPVPPAKVPTPAPPISKEPTQVPIQTQPIPPTIAEQVQAAATTIENLTAVSPQELTSDQVTQLTEAANTTLANAAEDSPQYQQALDALMVAAKADDIQVDPQLAAVPVLGAVATGVTNAINALGNLGSDMSPAHRAKAKKEVVAAVVATGAAVNAVTGAAGAAGATSSSSTSSIRRKEK